MSSLLEKLKECTETPHADERTRYSESFTEMGYTIPEDMASLDGVYCGGFFQKRETGLTWNFLSPSDLCRTSIFDDMSVPKEAKWVPLIDCSEGEYICFDTEQSVYLLWNAIDQEKYDTFSSLEAVLSSDI